MSTAEKAVFHTTTRSGKNFFDHDETIFAAYTNVSKTFGKTSVQAGLWVEQTNNTGNSIALNKID